MVYTLSPSDTRGLQFLRRLPIGGQMDGSEVIFGFFLMREQYREVPEKPFRCVHVSNEATDYGAVIPRQNSGDVLTSSGSCAWR